jgi:CheY-like chemotaxis protein
MEWDAASIPRYLAGDEGKLRQVLVNLIGNAAKFTVTGGIAVRVRAEAVAGKAGEDEPLMRLVVEVEDTGPGISTGEIGRIFGRFQQGCTGVKAGGTGLGLTISRKFVEMMGGELTVTSQEGKGSCFRFQVLLKPAVEVADQDKSPFRRVIGLKPGTGPFRILVVDDAPANRALLYTLLRPVGFELAEASNGVEALDVFEKWSPSAILMDMYMPLMDGYEATRRIKTTKAGSATPIIAVTASIFEDSKNLVIEAGADVYLRKPFQVKELFEVLGKCLDLCYVFADEPDKTLGQPEPASLMPAVPLTLPKKLIQAMRQAVKEGDIGQLTELIVRVEKLDSVKARVLQALADEYDYARLDQWLEKEGTDNA